MTLVNKNLGYAGLDRTLTLLQIESQRHGERGRWAVRQVHGILPAASLPASAADTEGTRGP